jgi:2-keto-4-pentenoate hydratase
LSKTTIAATAAATTIMSTSNNTPTLLQSTALGGSAAVFAVNFTHPIELVKSRVQINNMGVMKTISDTMKNEGIAAFWKVSENQHIVWC